LRRWKAPQVPRLVPPETKQHDSLTLQEEFTWVGNDLKRSRSLRNFILRPRCKNATKTSVDLIEQGKKMLQINRLNVNRNT